MRQSNKLTTPTYEQFKTRSYLSFLYIYNRHTCPIHIPIYHPSTFYLVPHASSLKSIPVSQHRDSRLTSTVAAPSYIHKEQNELERKLAWFKLAHYFSKWKNTSNVNEDAHIQTEKTTVPKKRHRKRIIVRKKQKRITEKPIDTLDELIHIALSFSKKKTIHCDTKYKKR